VLGGLGGGGWGCGELFAVAFRESGNLYVCS
jgi:hypothetical protein